MLVSFKISLLNNSFLQVIMTNLNLKSFYAAFIRLLVLTAFYEISTGALDVSFQSDCRKNYKGDQDCYFMVQDHWDFLKFRKWLDNLNFVRDVSLRIACAEGGSLYIPWPMRARNLKKLEIKDCLLKGYFDENNVKSKYPDTLEVRNIANSAIEISLFEWFNMIKDMQPTKSYTCGQESLVKSIERNNTYRFVNTPKLPGRELFDVLSQIGDSFRDKVRTQPFDCHYKRLIYLENSDNPSLGKHFMEDLTLHSNFPRLKALNLSFNRLSQLPLELKKWYISFPKLEYLNLSNNDLDTFSFTDPKRFGRNKGLHVNLRSNNIRFPPRDFYRYPHRSVPISVDLRENPIR